MQALTASVLLSDLPAGRIQFAIGTFDSMLPLARCSTPNGVAVVAAQAVNKPLDSFAACESSPANQSGFQLDAAANTTADPAVDGRQMRLARDKAWGLFDGNKRFVVNVNHFLSLVVFGADLHCYVESKQIDGVTSERLSLRL